MTILSIMVSPLILAIMLQKLMIKSWSFCDNTFTYIFGVSSSEITIIIFLACLSGTQIWHTQLKVVRGSY